MTYQVIDTSALVKYVLPEDHSDVAERLVSLHRIFTIQLIAPDYILIECANVLWKHVRRNNIRIEDAVSGLRSLQNLHIRLVPQSELLEEALLLAAEINITVYDALFCVLARRENAPLITNDRPLVNRLAGTGIRGLALADWAGPA